MTVENNLADNFVEITPEAREQYAACLSAVHAANVWAEGLDIDTSWLEASEVVAKRRIMVHEMASSLSGNLSRLFFTPASDGHLKIMSDPAPLSFFWRYESGYHGGLIFQASYDGRERLPVGTWSVNT